MASKFGYVIGTAMQKTIKVRVENIKIHPIVKKVDRYGCNPLSSQCGITKTLWPMMKMSHVL